MYCPSFSDCCEKGTVSCGNAAADGERCVVLRVEFSNVTIRDVISSPTRFNVAVLAERRFCSRVMDDGRVDSRIMA